ncbi:MAG TPA: helix-turn-helix domain-containing protein [Ktedonobacterales bacterium]|jgi:AcrR family transcriptional regulator
MNEPVKSLPKRRYDSSRRQAAAIQTRHAIAVAARDLFIARGYAGTTMAAIAEAAGVSHETVYATFGPKPALFRHLVEIALSGADEPIPALEREIVRQVRAEPDPRRMIDLFAHSIRLLHERLAPLFVTLSDGAWTDSDLKAFADELSSRRVGHMRAFVADLAAKGGLRADLSPEMAADVIWVMNSSEFYLLCVRDRGWSPETFERWLADGWKRLLLPLSLLDDA